MPRLARAGRPNSAPLEGAVETVTQVSTRAMPDRCTISRVAMSGTLDQATGVWQPDLGISSAPLDLDAPVSLDTSAYTLDGQPVGGPILATELYAGHCRVQTTSGNLLRERVVEIGEQPVTLHQYLVVVPVDAGDIQIDDIVHVDTCGHDPTLVGRDLRVAELVRSSFAALRYLACEENLG